MRKEIREQKKYLEKTISAKKLEIEYLENRLNQLKKEIKLDEELLELLKV